MIGWKDDKRWSDKFLPEIKRILGEHLIGEPPVDEDQERNTDLIVLKMEPLRIACRIRRNKYLTQYGNEFTIRAGRPSGAKTELTKIIEGWGDYFFYAFSDAEELSLSKWALCDLKVFRLWFNRQIIKLDGAIPGKQKNNIDGSSNFLAYCIDNFPLGFVVANK